MKVPTWKNGNTKRRTSRKREFDSRKTGITPIKWSYSGLNAYAALVIKLKGKEVIYLLQNTVLS